MSQRARWNSIMDISGRTRSSQRRTGARNLLQDSLRSQQGPSRFVKFEGYTAEVRTARRHERQEIPNLFGHRSGMGIRIESHHFAAAGDVDFDNSRKIQ